MATAWIGTAAPIVLLNGVDIPQYNAFRTIPINPASVAVTWNGDGRGPPGASCLCLASTFTQGYKVAYKYSYTVNGRMYADPGSNVWMNTNLNAVGSTQSYYTFVPQTVKDYWQYGPDPATQIAVNGQGIPNGITYNFYTNNWTAGHYPTGFTWIMNVTIMVSQNCTQDNLHSQLCLDICQADVNQCVQEYGNYCLSNNAANLGDPICGDYYTEYIAANNSTGEIDQGYIHYCSPYRGFADLFESNTLFSDERRAKDIPLCACYLTAKDVSDPSATVLYDRYRTDLERRVPSIASSGIKEKCLVSQCAGAHILPADIPAKSGGCPVPKCFNTVVINNDGTIKSINVDQNCGGITAAEAFVIAFLVVFIVLILIVVYFRYAPSRTVRAKSSPSNYPVRSIPGAYMAR